MRIEDISKKYPFSSAAAANLLELALATATVIGMEVTRDILKLASVGETPRKEGGTAYNLMCQNVEKHAWTLDNIAELAEKVAPMVDQYTFRGMMQMIRESPRPCLVENRKYWFLRWETKKWVIEPSPMVGGGHDGGQCEVVMAIVEDQETGQVHEVYPREVRFLDSVCSTRDEGDA